MMDGGALRKPGTEFRCTLMYGMHVFNETPGPDQKLRIGEKGVRNEMFSLEKDYSIKYLTRSFETLEQA